mmetsp:Transcript_9629/g.16175  ORF Transcript_9629/g.16175 Transcript_9629/m.16175 type:complete len:84 (-) Transcript_9629:887-1138(-)
MNTYYINCGVTQLPIYLLHTFVVFQMAKTVVNGFQKRDLIQQSYLSNSFWLSLMINDIMLVWVLGLRYGQHNDLQSLLVEHMA